MRDNWIKRLMFGTDIGFLAYWAATATGLIAAYRDPVLVAWNWSFLTLDLMASGTGLLALFRSRRGRSGGRALVLVSLALTHAAGLLALSFWALRGEFSVEWWLPNLWLTLFPVAAVGSLLVCPKPDHESSNRANRLGWR